MIKVGSLVVILSLLVCTLQAFDKFSVDGRQAIIGLLKADNKQITAEKNILKEELSALNKFVENNEQSDDELYFFELRNQTQDKIAYFNELISRNRSAEKEIIRLGRLKKADVIKEEINDLATQLKIAQAMPIEKISELHEFKTKKHLVLLGQIEEKLAKRELDLTKMK